MAVRLEVQQVKRFIGSSSDTKPFVGTQADGSTILATDLPIGSMFTEEDTGDEYRWNSASWVLVKPEAGTEQTTEDKLFEVLAEMKLELAAIRTGLEWQLGLDHNLKLDLRTEKFVEANSNG